MEGDQQQERASLRNVQIQAELLVCVSSFWQFTGTRAKDNAEDMVKAIWHYILRDYGEEESCREEARNGTMWYDSEPISRIQPYLSSQMKFSTSHAPFQF